MLANVVDADAGATASCPITGGVVELRIEEETTEIDWYKPLNALRSRGSQAERPGSLAGLHAMREVTLSQFFTPNAVVRFIWDLITPCLEDAWQGYGKFSIFDNSFGSGRMFQYADPEKHFLLGCEIDAPMVEAVSEAVKAAGFEFQFEQGSMEEFRPANFCVGLINPPFSIMLDNPLVEPFKCNSYGRYGKRSSAKTQTYALAQALKGCRVVVAVMPTSFTKEATDPEGIFYPRLHTIFNLPAGTFREEGTDVATSLFVFNKSKVEDGHKRVFNLTDLVFRPEYLEGDVRTDNVMGRTRDLHPGGSSWGSHELERARATGGRPAITRKVTGDKTVRLCHSGRRLVLKFGCGLTEAMVKNRVYEALVSHDRGRGEGRVPRGVEFTGEGWLDLENYLLQPSPVGALMSFASRIVEWGFKPVMDLGLRNYLRKRTRRQRLLTTPLRQAVYQTDGGVRHWITQQAEIRGVCKQQFSIWANYGKGQGPQMMPGQEVRLERSDTAKTRRFYFKTVTESGYVTEEKLFECFSFPDCPARPEGWDIRHAGLREQFPDQWKWTEARARRSGVDRWLTWGYQWHDAIEIAMRRGNTIIGWEMGLGKARLALALCLIGDGKSNVVLLESRLISEMRKEIQGLDIPAGDWQVIEKLEDCRELRKINIISYNKLRSAEKRTTKRGAQKKCYPFANALRRRVHTMVVDEGHNLKDFTSDQSKAAQRVAARQRYILTGTPIDNYPRDILPLMRFVAGDGTAHQPYGGDRPFMRAENLRSMDKATRGVDVFREMFVTLDWVTHEFEDGMVAGAKREIPKIKDVTAFRKMVAPIVKRRLMREPAGGLYPHTGGRIQTASGGLGFRAPEALREGLGVVH